MRERVNNEMFITERKRLREQDSTQVEFIVESIEWLVEKKIRWK